MEIHKNHKTKQNKKLKKKSTKFCKNIILVVYLKRINSYKYRYIIYHIYIHINYTYIIKNIHIKLSKIIAKLSIKKI